MHSTLFLANLREVLKMVSLIQKNSFPQHYSTFTMDTHIENNQNTSVLKKNQKQDLLMSNSVNLLVSVLLNMKLYQLSNPILDQGKQFYFFIYCLNYIFFSFGIERCLLEELISKEELRSINNTVRCAHTLHEPILSVPQSETLICGSSNTYSVIEMHSF